REVALLPGQRLLHGVEAASHVGAVITVADGGVELREVVASRMHGGADLRHPGGDGGRLHCGFGDHDRHAPQRSAAVSTGASHRVSSSSSSSSTVSDAPAISSEVM